MTEDKDKKVWQRTVRFPLEMRARLRKWSRDAQDADMPSAVNQAIIDAVSEWLDRQEAPPQSDELSRLLEIAGADPGKLLKRLTGEQEPWKLRAAFIKYMRELQPGPKNLAGQAKSTIDHPGIPVLKTPHDPHAKTQVEGSANESAGDTGGVGVRDGASKSEKGGRRATGARRRRNLPKAG